MDAGARHPLNAADPLALEQERASLALSAARMGEFEWDAHGDRMIISERLAAITGFPAGHLPLTQGGRVLPYIHPDDVAAFPGPSIYDIARHDRIEADFRLTRPDNGKLIWLHFAAVTLRDPQGKPERVIGVVQDITERKAEEQARDTLVAELDHRVKNVLASVQSLAAQSARKTTSLDAFLKTFAGRLEAMAAAHTLLTATRWRGAEIGNIAAAELGGLASGRARWSGPEILLNPRATNALTLALHELATNAVKFGALSHDSGRVDVTWTRRPGGGFELTWSERGGPPVNQPTRRGFGATLLERVTGRELGGEAVLDFRSGGVRAVIRADATALADEAGAPVAQAKAASAEPDGHAGASEGVLAADSVRGRRIIIVEDAVLLALELEAGLTEAGACVVGTASNVEEALVS
jgi:PAS domain S-box-containing protein